jgi:hypothetical protein
MEKIIGFAAGRFTSCASVLKIAIRSEFFFWGGGGPFRVDTGKKIKKKSLPKIGT